MRRNGPAILLVLSVGCAATARGPAPSPKPVVTMKPPALPYPKTLVQDIRDTLFGVSVPDPYRWLEDGKSEEVRRWADAQDQVARGYLAQLPGRDKLRERLQRLYYVDALSPPLRRGARYFYFRTHADKEKAVYYYREGEQGKEQVLLDPNQMSPDGSISLGVTAPSYDGKLLCYALRKNNADEATLYVMNVKSGRVSAVDIIEGAKYASPSWTPKGDGFYYTYLPSEVMGKPIPVAERPGYAELRYHKLGTDPKKDPLVYPHSGDPSTFLSGQLSRDGRFLLVYLHRGWSAVDVFYRDQRARRAAKGGASFRPLVVGQPSLYAVEVHRDQFFISTNEGKSRSRVFRASAEQPERGSWQEIIPEHPESNLEGVEVLGGYLVATYLHRATSQFRIFTLDGAPVGHVPLPGLGTAYVVGNPEDDVAYYHYSSFTAPPQVHRVSLRALIGGAVVAPQRPFAEVKLPIDPSPYTVEQVFYPSKDGTAVSMFLVHRKDLRRDGSTPFLLAGYGGFAQSMGSSFGAGLYPFLEAGGGYALPNLRGGGEYGEAWHQAGMLTRKQNVFDDFIAAAEYLIREGYTARERLAIRGGSNGGLLVGAALTQRPDLFRAVLCQVPLLDMLRYHLHGSGRTWVPEYGSAEDEVGFRSLFAYSPYHRVKVGVSYPAVFLLSADSDDRVDPMHARKMAAALQAASGSGAPVLLRVEKNAGHGGADLVRQAVEQGADAYAFLMKELGMTP